MSLYEIHTSPPPDANSFDTRYGNARWISRKVCIVTYRSTCGCIAPRSVHPEIQSLSMPYMEPCQPSGNTPLRSSSPFIAEMMRHCQLGRIAISGARKDRPSACACVMRTASMRRRPYFGNHSIAAAWKLLPASTTMVLHESLTDSNASS